MHTFSLRSEGDMQPLQPSTNTVLAIFHGRFSEGFKGHFLFNGNVVIWRPDYERQMFIYHKIHELALLSRSYHPCLVHPN